MDCYMVQNFWQATFDYFRPFVYRCPPVLIDLCKDKGFFINNQIKGVKLLLIKTY